MKSEFPPLIFTIAKTLLMEENFIEMFLSFIFYFFIEWLRKYIFNEFVNSFLFFENFKGIYKKNA